MSLCWGLCYSSRRSDCCHTWPLAHVLSRWVKSVTASAHHSFWYFQSWCHAHSILGLDFALFYFRCYLYDLGEIGSLIHLLGCERSLYCRLLVSSWLRHGGRRGLLLRSLSLHSDRLIDHTLDQRIHRCLVRSSGHALGGYPHLRLELRLLPASTRRYLSIYHSLAPRIHIEIFLRNFRVLWHGGYWPTIGLAMVRAGLHDASLNTWLRNAYSFIQVDLQIFLLTKCTQIQFWDWLGRGKCVSDCASKFYIREMSYVSRAITVRALACNHHFRLKRIVHVSKVIRLLAMLGGHCHPYSHWTLVGIDKGGLVARRANIITNRKSWVYLNHFFWCLEYDSHAVFKRVGQGLDQLALIHLLELFSLHACFEYGVGPDIGIDVDFAGFLP